MELEQVPKTHFHRFIVVKGLVGRKKPWAIRKGVPLHTHNITMSNRADFKHLVGGSVV